MQTASVIVIILLIFLYFVPIIVATMQDHKNTASIAIINVLLGWTFIGWVIALAWAFKSN